MDDPVKINQLSSAWEELQKEALPYFLYDPHIYLDMVMDKLCENPKKSVHIKGFTRQEEDLADIVIWTMACAEHFNCDLFGAVLQKIKYNKDQE